jgi:hypothetical protein
LSEDPSDLSIAFQLRQLEYTRNGILREEDDQWRLRSKAWLDSGNKNSKYFHNYANYNRVKKHIWQIDNTNGQTVSDHNSIKEAVVNYFKDCYKEQTVLNLTDQCQILEYYPQIFTEEEAKSLVQQVTLEEVKEVLFLFQKEKSSGLDGCTIELFISFFDLVGEDVLAMVEESKALELLREA